MTEALDKTTLNLMSEVFSRYPNLQQVMLYGSRAKGTHHERSDIDIALVGQHLDRFTVGAVQMDLDDLEIPWQIDVQSLQELQNPALVEHINRIGRVIWQENS